MAIRSGQDIPERIANAPKINTAYVFYLDCFYDLMDNVNWVNITKYGAYYNLNYETIEDLLIILPLLQASYDKMRKK